MKEKLYCLLSTFAVAIFVGGCFLGPIYEEDLVNGYAVWATDVMEQAKIVKKRKEISSTTTFNTVVPATVFAYGWNEDFILAKQHPRKSYREVDTSITYWYIIEVISGDVHGPLNEDEFRKLRTKLKVPEEISFKTIQ